MYGLKPHIIRSIQEVFTQYEQIEKVLLYGSRAKGNYQPGSDIDLVLMAPLLTTKHLLKIENDLDDLLLPYKIDLALYHHVQDQEIREHIKHVGKVFYDQKK
jgi:predicted nucleotidyltransferase